MPRNPLSLSTLLKYFLLLLLAREFSSGIVRVPRTSHVSKHASMYVRVYVGSTCIYNNLIIEYHGLVLKELSQVKGHLFSTGLEVRKFR